jgi:hypothetical protein
MTLLESYTALDSACGPEVNILIEPTIKRYSFERHPSLSYRIHLWLDRGLSMAFHFCREGTDLEALTQEAIDSWTTWRAPNVARISRELHETAAA